MVLLMHDAELIIRREALKVAHEHELSGPAHTFVIKSFKSKPISAGTPRDPTSGEALHSGRLIEFYNEREYASDLVRNEVLRPGEDDVDPMPLVHVKRGEASWR